MAPRVAKAKKTDVKNIENEVPKKGRGKAKAFNEELDPQAEEKSEPVAKKKTKRGRKPVDGTNDETNTNEPALNGDSPSNNEENGEANGHTEPEKVTTGKGRKKQIKKSDKQPIKEKPSRGKKTVKQDDVAAEVGEKTKVTGKGRGRKVQTKAETPDEDAEHKTDEAEAEIVKAEPTSKGRKKGSKVPKEIVSEHGDDLKNVDQEEPKKKETKGRKKVLPMKHELENKEDIMEEEETKKKETKGRKKALSRDDEFQTKEDLEDKDIEEEAEELKKKEPKNRKKGQPKEDEVMDNQDDVSEIPAKKRKVRKEEKVETKDEDDTGEETESKPIKAKKGTKKAIEPLLEEIEESQDNGESAVKRKRKATDDKAPPEGSKKKAPLKNKSTTNYEQLDFTNNTKNTQGKEWNFKISSWNVDGIRAWMSKGGLDYIKYEKPDILCLQEVKCAKEQLPDELVKVPGYHAYWLCSDQDGYAGVGIYTTKLAISVQYGLQDEELDGEGRIITAEYEQFYLICTYVPNAGRKLVTLPKRLKWNEAFRNYVKKLDAQKPVIICGDMNVAHNEIDLANPKTNRKNAGFTDEERAGMTELLGDGFIDSYRHLNPDKTGAYTFWTYMMNSRSKNVGWRLDYFLISERLQSALCDCVIRESVYGSDHCPISLFLHLTTADKPKE